MGILRLFERGFAGKLLSVVLAITLVVAFVPIPTASVAYADDTASSVAANAPPQAQEEQGDAADQGAAPAEGLAAADQGAAVAAGVQEDAAPSADAQGDASLSETSWYSAEATNLTIGTAAELAEFATIVNGTHATYAQDSFKGKTVTLSADIDLSSVCGAGVASWTPIGNATCKYNASSAATGYLDWTGYAFLGTFDGAGKTISNLYISSTSGYLGLFGNVGGTDTVGADGYGTVKNFTISGSVACTNATAQATDYVAAVVGLLNPGGTISDVVNKANVTANNTMNVGGIVGFTGTGYDLGGASNMKVAQANPSGENTYVLRCGNEGNITGYYKAGGIVGENACKVLYCYNSGTIQQVLSGSGGGIGGIAGRNGNRDNSDNCEVGTIMYCYNAGTIKGTNPSGTTIRGYGGITGWNNIISKVQHNYAAGVVEVGYSDYQAVVGRVDNGSGLGDNYALDTLNDKYYSTDVDKLKAGIKKTAAELKVQTYNEGDILTLLAPYFVADTTSINGGMPVLWWQNGSTLPTISSMSITTPPTKTTYTAGETFDATGMVLKGTYSDGNQHVISASDCAYNTGALTVEDTSITFSYTAEGTTVTASQAITVNAAVLSGLVVTTQPTYKTYAADESFDKTGMVITASYNDGAVTKTLSDEDYTVTEDRENDKVVISYTEGEVTKTVDQPITFLSSSAPVAVENVYPLGSDEDLVWFSAQVNERAQTAINGKLTADIDLSGVAYTPIGSTSTKAFSGTLDGNGKTITYGSDTTFTVTSYQGLIGYLGAGSVKNLTTAGSVSLTGSYSSPIVGCVKAANASVVDCTNNATVTSSAGTIGGIVANTSVSCTISGCENSGAITSTSSNVGGIVGYPNADAVSIAGCENTGAITGTMNVGGIVGNGKAGIDSCSNGGAVTATTAASGSAGGVIGNATSTSLTAGNVVECANTGAVKGGKAGGIVGSTYKTAYEDCYSTGAVEGTGTSATAAGSGGLLGAYTLNNAGATFTNCYSTGEVTGTVNANALIGYDTKGAVLSNCYFIGTDKTTAIWGGSAAKTTGYACKSSSEMKLVEFVASLNGVSGTAFNFDGPGASSINGGYPVLAWQGGTPAADVSVAGVSSTAANLKVGDEFVVTVTVKGSIDGDALAVVEGTLGYDTTALELTGIAKNEATDGEVGYNLATGTFSIMNNTKATADGLAVIDATFVCKAASAGASVNVKDVEVAASGQAFGKDAAVGAAISLPIYYKYTKGDVNNNSKINVIDAQVVLDMANSVYGTDYAKLLEQLQAAGTTWGKATVAKAADADENDVVDALDARAIQHYWHTDSWTTSEA